MLDPVSVLSYAQTIVAITSLLQERHKDHPAELNSLNEGHQIAREIDRLALELPKSLDNEVEDEIVQLGSALSDIRESYSSAKSREDLQGTTERLRAFKAQLSSILDKHRDEGEVSYQLSLSLPGSEDRLLSSPNVGQNGGKPDEVTVWVEAGRSRRPIPARALLDTGSRVNLVSERFLNSLETSTSWSAAIARWLFRYRGDFLSSSYRWSQDPQGWLGLGPAKLRISLSQSSPPVHDLSLTVHHGASFFGDMLLGVDSLQRTGLLRQPSAAGFGQQGLVPICDRREQTTANIILVHSLHGNARETWRGRSNAFWPKDFLVEDLEKCSIWTYSYDVNKERSKFAKSFEKMMDDLANDLLKEIDRYTNKPILWICHSLGGHLVKFALTRSRARSHARSRRLADPIPRSSKTKGVIFLGTPHGPSTSIDVFEDIMTVSLESRERPGKQTKLQSHKFDNSLAYTASAFGCLMDREFFPILSLFENKPMLTKRGPRKIVLPFTRMHHPEEHWDYLEGDHLSMCRFETREEKGYQKILTSVKDLLEGKGFADVWQDDEVDRARSRSMRTSVSDEELVDIDKIYLNLRLKIDLQTARWHSPKSEDIFDSTWIRSDPLLTKWLDGKHKKPFLICGPVGCGKSKIAESLQEWLEVPQQQSNAGNPSSRTCRLQLFFKLDQRCQQTLTTMLEFLIAQTLDQNESLVYHVSKRKLFSKSLPLSLAHGLLQNTLRIMLEDTCWSSIFLVVDALDECNPEYAAAILETLNFIFKIQNVKALLTISTAAASLSEKGIVESRDTPFDAFITNNQCVVMNLPQNEAWIEVLTRYLEDRLLHVSNEIAKHSERLKEALLRLPNLSFFVIDLALQHLQNVLSEKDSLQEFAFETQLEQMNTRARIDGLLIDLANTRPETGHWVLSVLACAFEPLRLQELAAIFMRDPETVWEGVKGDQLWTSAHLQSLVDNDLLQLVYIDGDGLHLASQSVRHVINDRMARSAIIHPDASKAEGGWYDPQQLHLRLSKICLQMLLERVDFKKKSKPDTRMAPLPAEGYARRHWQNHLREAGVLASDINSLVMQWIQAPKESQHEKVKGPSGASSTMLLQRLTDNNLFRTMGSMFEDSSLGLQLPDPADFDRVLEQSISASTSDTLQVLRDISKRIGDDYNKTQMLFAMAEGDKNTLTRLLTPLEALTKSNYLHKAIEIQNEDIVQIILDSYSEIHDIPEKSSELAYAVEFQSHGIFSRMLKRKELFDLDTALLAAVNVANFSMCEALLASGAKVCLIQTDETARTPLHIAAQRGKKELVELMLKWNSPVNIRDSKDQTPLHHAAKSGRIDIIKALLAGSASVVAEDEQGWTALFTACAFGQVEAARLLWASGATIFHRDKDDRSMLHSATKHGHVEVVSMLLSAGISAESADVAGITPIHEGCRSGWAPIVDKLVDKLLQTGASINVADKRGRTCLHYACQCRNVPESVVQLLFDMGADASARDADGCTPLMLAAQSSTVRVLKIFWTHDRRLFRDADQKGRRVLDYLHAKGNSKTGENYEEKADFLANYYAKMG